MIWCFRGRSGQVMLLMYSTGTLCLCRPCLIRVPTDLCGASSGTQSLWSPSCCRASRGPHHRHINLHAHRSLPPATTSSPPLPGTLLQQFHRTPRAFMKGGGGNSTTCSPVMILSFVCHCQYLVGNHRWWLFVFMHNQPCHWSPVKSERPHVSHSDQSTGGQVDLL